MPPYRFAGRHRFPQRDCHSATATAFTALGAASLKGASLATATSGAVGRERIHRQNSWRPTSGSMGAVLAAQCWVVGICSDDWVSGYRSEVASSSLAHAAGVESAAAASSAPRDNHPLQRQAVEVVTWLLSRGTAVGTWRVNLSQGRLDGDRRMALGVSSAVTHFRRPPRIPAHIVVVRTTPNRL